MIGKTNMHAVHFGDEEISFFLRRSERKTLAITVRPDTTVAVTAPKGADIEVIKARVHAKGNWILRQRAFFEEYLPPAPPRRYVSGETHRYLGRQYRLKIVEGAEDWVTLKRPYLFVSARDKNDVCHIKQLVQAWYVKRARSVFSRSLEICLSKLKNHLNQPVRMQLRRMPKRWGSWTQRGVIYLNPELVKSSRSCIDYVVVHELCHLVHGNHGNRFYNLLRQVMPDWEERKALLEKGAAN